MNIFVRITGNFIIAIGLVIVLGGILIIIGFGNWFSGDSNLSSAQNLLNEGLNLISLLAGGKVILDGLIYMAVGEFLVLFVSLVEYIKNIAGKSVE